MFMGRILTTIMVATLFTPLPAHAAAPTTGTTNPTPVPAGRRVDSARHPAIQAGVTELTKEIESALRGGEEPSRAHPDYFYGATDIPPAAVITALRRPLANDPRVSAYVKWQLLSALPKELDEKTSAELLQIYRSAPGPLPRLGMEKQSRDDLDRMIRNAKEDDAERLVEQFEQMDERVVRDNTFILKYRDGLFAKLPTGFDAIAAGLEDAAVRLNVGADVAEHTRAVCKAVEGWAPNAPPEQLKAVFKALAQLERKKGQEYYSRVYWSASGKMQWTKTQATLGRVSQLEEVQEFLEDQIKNPTAPLKMKGER